MIIHPNIPDFWMTVVKDRYTRKHSSSNLRVLHDLRSKNALVCVTLAIRIFIATLAEACA
jgi:hypothetical protein